MSRENYELAKKQLLQLHAMIAQGTDQTDEADALRDEMDAPWYRLNELESERLNNLSGDLYMISGEEVKVKADSPLTDQEINDRLQSEDNDRILDLLRRSDCPLEQHRVACLRALCWFDLGDYDVALLFAEYAAKLKPEESIYRDLVIATRSALGLIAGPTKSNSVNLSSPHDIHALITEMSHLQSA